MFGLTEIVIIIIVALVIFVFFGSAKIPEFAKALRKGVDEFKKTSDDISKPIVDELTAKKPEEQKK
jgi:TatA/E family protein of Tat protein translocase